jgi:hypothetical protein
VRRDVFFGIVSALSGVALFCENPNSKVTFRFSIRVFLGHISYGCYRVVSRCLVSTWGLIFLDFRWLCWLLVASFGFCFLAAAFGFAG